MMPAMTRLVILYNLWWPLQEEKGFQLVEEKQKLRSNYVKTDILLWYVSDQNSIQPLRERKEKQGHGFDV